MKIEKEYNTIGELFKYTRIFLNLSLRQVSKQIKLSIATLSRIERNQGEPLFWNIVKLSIFYNIEDELFDFIKYYKGNCGECGLPVSQAYPWWTKHPQKKEAKPLHKGQCTK